jgi:uncharacterized membrane protein
MEPTTLIAAFGLAFLLSHLLLSHGAIREGLLQRLGRVPFVGLYSVVSAVFWIPLLWVWWTNPHAGSALWVARHPAVVHGAELVNLLALGMLVSGAVLASPASMTRMIDDDPAAFEVSGMPALTRHPVSMGIGTLALTHMVLNGWVGDLWFWGTHAALAFGGAWHQDLRHRAMRPAYAAYASQTTFWPDPRGLGRVGVPAWGLFAVGAVVALAVRAAHPWFVG